MCDCAVKSRQYSTVSTRLHSVQPKNATGSPTFRPVNFGQRAAACGDRPGQTSPILWLDGVYDSKKKASPHSSALYFYLPCLLPPPAPPIPPILPFLRLSPFTCSHAYTRCSCSASQRCAAMSEGQIFLAPRACPLAIISHACKVGYFWFCLLVCNCNTLALSSLRKMAFMNLFFFLYRLCVVSTLVVDCVRLVVEEGFRPGTKFYHLGDGGHAYHFNAETGSTIYFKCALYERYGCLGRAIYKFRGGAFRHTGYHNHPADPNFVGMRHFRQNVLRQVDGPRYVSFEEIVQNERANTRSALISTSLFKSILSYSNEPSK